MVEHDERHRRAWLRRLGFVLHHRRRNQRAGGRREDPLRREGEVRRSKHGHIGAGAAPPEQAQHPLWTEATTAAPEHKSLLRTQRREEQTNIATKGTRILRYEEARAK